MIVFQTDLLSAHMSAGGNFVIQPLSCMNIDLDDPLWFETLVEQQYE